MLQPASAFDDLDTRLGMFLSQHIAQDPDTGAYLTGSNGRRRSGRNRRYCVTVPTCNLEPLPGGQAYSESVYLKFTAESDEQAIEKANKRLARKAA